ncbi:NmrA family protein [Periweissella cryptocerci]|uniref:NmrA family protein n=1 Tax=Periweissella cryptocerci TaxID=2506420 RepID=A0A4P6YV92_9LACO|nr:NmrA family NAD(P)-binding protein [Periweissella cryptocerci]QBO36627.1 NmrA family protein [Periweissella cryptocerci]
MILVTSAFGHTGQIFIKQLLAANQEVRAIDINPQVTTLQDLGVKETIVGDLRDADVIRDAVKGVDSILYIPPLFTAEEFYSARYTIDMAVKYNVKHFVFVSVTHPIMSTLLQHTTKRESEEYLVYTGLKTNLKYTILQPMHYMHNFNSQQVLASDKYEIFYDVNTRLSYVDPNDVGTVAVKVLTHPDEHNGATYELVGDDFLSPVELVEQFNELTGKDARATKVEIDDFLDSVGFQNVYTRIAFKQLAKTYSEFGIFGNSTVLTMLLGHKPTNFKEYVQNELNDLN